MDNKEITIYYNGNFHTMNEAQPNATAVACNGGKIVAVGNYNDFGELTELAEMIDLCGCFVFPGFIDTHSAPGIEAFNKAFALDEELSESEAVQWTKDAMMIKVNKLSCFLNKFNAGFLN